MFEDKKLIFQWVNSFFFFFVKQSPMYTIFHDKNWLSLSAFKENWAMSGSETLAPDPSEENSEKFSFSKWI